MVSDELPLLPPSPESSPKIPARLQKKAKQTASRQWVLDIIVVFVTIFYYCGILMYFPCLMNQIAAGTQYKEMLINESLDLELSSVNSETDSVCFKNETTKYSLDTFLFFLIPSFSIACKIVQFVSITFIAFKIEEGTRNSVQRAYKVTYFFIFFRPLLAFFDFIVLPFFMHMLPMVSKEHPVLVMLAVSLCLMQVFYSFASAWIDATITIQLSKFLNGAHNEEDIEMTERDFIDAMRSVRVL
ncbi:hypothetical protein CRE_10972 [Caenorhabditis remanei]|uniref:Uncharacterized protein n=1 Tax=Caenorhabditis remanei TaxID=31234 RepID=E3M5T1_CAERE|nr:hypothetical protein CRE_10972 [Caenorhabditis remanei]